VGALLGKKGRKWKKNKGMVRKGPVRLKSSENTFQGGKLGQVKASQEGLGAREGWGVGGGSCCTMHKQLILFKRAIKSGCSVLNSPCRPGGTEPAWAGMGGWRHRRPDGWRMHYGHHRCRRAGTRPALAGCERRDGGG
jgi:hypothetical protein